MVKKEEDDEIFIDNKVKIVKPYYERNVEILAKELSEKKLKKYDILISLINVNIIDEPKYIKRLLKEFKLITYFGFEEVFYQVSEILELTKEYPHIIRGSAGACLLCYYMKITNNQNIYQIK